MRNRMMSARQTGKCKRGFSLIELMIVVAVGMILMAIVPPLMLNTISNMKLRYSATDLSGLIQKARMQAVMKNTFYPINATTLSAGDVGYFVDLSKPSTGIYAAGDPMVEMGGQVNVHAGPGSGAPGETAFITGSLKFAVDASGVLPRFNARGLPCSVVGNTCPQTPGQGFVYFLSRTSTFGTSWASVSVTPSGRAQVWSYDGANWVQQ
jgi:prepilin-type N-terminal cleavage/methylation domain-containing protein